MTCCTKNEAGSEAISVLTVGGKWMSAGFVFQSRMACGPTLLINLSTWRLAMSIIKKPRLGGVSCQLTAKPIRPFWSQTSTITLKPMRVRRRQGPGRILHAQFLGGKVRPMRIRKVCAANRH